MLAVVYQGPRSVRVQDVPDATLEAGSDALVRVTSSAICGTVPWATLFGTSVAVRFGRTNDRRYTTQLRDLITSGRARPGRIVTHHAGPHDAPELYRQFDRREGGVIKAILNP